MKYQYYIFKMNSNYFLPIRNVVAAVVLLLGTTSFEANAQTGNDALRFAQRAPGLTVKSMGLGGASSAGMADGAAFITNPAGLAWAETSLLSGSFTSMIATDRGTFDAGSGRTAIDDEITSSGLGNLSYLFKVPTSRGSMVVGASFSEVASFERSLFFDGENGSNSVTDFFIPFTDEFDLQDDGEGGVFPNFSRTISFIAFETFAIDLDGGLLDAGDLIPFLPAVSAGTVAQTGFVEESGRMLELNFGGAAEVAQNVMVGMSLNIPFGSYEFQRVLEEDDFLNHNDGTGGTTDFSFLHFSERFESDLVGVNLRLGLSAQVNKNLRLGAGIETPTYYSIEDNFHTLLETEFDNGDFFSYGNEPDQLAGSGTFDYNVITPWKVSAGAAYSLNDWKFYGDIEVIDWSQMELDSDGFLFEDENDAIRRSLEGVVNVRLGASYDLNDWQFRAGVGVYPDAHSTEFALDGFPDVDRERTFASAGVGYSINDRASIDVAWMAEEYEDRYDLYNEVVDAPFVLEEVTRNRFQIGFSYAF